jgi:hypothetical protein
MDLATISLAINLSSPKLLTSKVKSYSQVIHNQSEKLNINPLIVIAIIKHESRWTQSLISLDGEDYGLMQVRARFTRTPKDRLLWGEDNIFVGTYMIKSSEHYCTKFLGRKPSTQEWLSCYQGSCTTPSHICKSTKMAAVVEQYAQCIQYSLEDLRCEFNCDLIYKFETKH